MSSLAMVLLLLMLAGTILAGLNQQLETFSALVRSESQAMRERAGLQSALEWGNVQRWSLEPDLQCRQASPPWRVCLRLLGEGNVLLIAGKGERRLWRSGHVIDGRVRFSPHGWSDFCPLKENALCQLP